MLEKIEKFFRADGPIAEELPQYVPRPQQLLASTAISRSMTQSRTMALVEAGTGVGKTLAYLVPAIMQARPQQKIIVSTHTLALQAQLWTRDIPLALKLPGKSLHTALLKGRGNYLCLQEMNAARQDLTITSNPQFDEILEWSDETETGDLAELSFTFADWSEISAHPDTCRGSDCRYFDDCFFYKAKRVAEDASIVLVNHALFFADLAMRHVDESMTLLPDYSFVVFDEAHHLENAASSAFGVTLTSSRVAALLKRLRKSAATFEMDEDRIRSFERESAELFSAFRDIGRSEFIVSEMMPDLSWAREKTDRMALILQEIIHGLSKFGTCGDQTQQERMEGLQRQITRLSEEVQIIFQPEDRNYIRWGATIAFRDRAVSVSIHLTPISVAPVLDEALWRHETRSAALVSATLATNGGFDYLKERLGLVLPASPVKGVEPQTTQIRDKKFVEVIVDSPFDYENNCLLYIPRHLPLPSDSLDYMSLVVAEITQLVYSSNGGAFLLFTSHRMLRHVYNLLSESNLPYPLFRQGEMPAGRLVDEYRKSRNGILFGTQSFWEGVDVPGDSLRLVVVDRLPFGSPESPMHKARVAAITAAGGDWFREFALPQAQLKLKQGFGRLIRNSTDRGVVAILDSRLVKKNYGQEFLKYLPPAKRTFYLDEVQTFYKDSVNGPPEL
jgi:ATP-dependent DNA helicase DinG